MKKIIVVLFVVLTLGFVSTVDASIVTSPSSNVSGTITEGTNAQLPSGVIADFTFGDFGNTFEDNSFSLDGDAQFYGRVSKCNGGGCFDNFIIEITSNQMFDLTFQALGGSNNFEMGVDMFGGVIFSGTLDNTIDIFSFTNVTAGTFVSLFGLKNNTRWLVSVTESVVTEVSTPATLSLFSLVIVGALYMRRQKPKVS